MTGYLPHHRRRSDPGDARVFVVAFAILYGLVIFAFWFFALWGRM